MRHLYGDYMVASGHRRTQTAEAERRKVPGIPEPYNIMIVAFLRTMTDNPPLFIAVSVLALFGAIMALEQLKN